MLLYLDLKKNEVALIQERCGSPGYFPILASAVLCVRKTVDRRGSYRVIPQCLRASAVIVGSDRPLAVRQSSVGESGRCFLVCSLGLLRPYKVRERAFIVW